MHTSRPLTPATIEGLRQGKLSDPQTPGLYVERLARGEKVWKYRRRLTGSGEIVKMRLGSFPAKPISQAREWARALNDQVENGIDPREVLRAAELRATMTVARAHEIYMEAVHEGRASRSKRLNKPRTISDKIEIFERDIAPALGEVIIYDVTEKQLIEIVTRKGRTAKVRANRLAAELKVFFGWAASLRGLEVGMEHDPSRRLGDLRFPEAKRSRTLSLDEIMWFLRAVAEESRDFRRGMLVWLLTAARVAEVVQAHSDEIVGGIWTIPAQRSKNRSSHAIALAAWGQSLMASNSEWVFPAERVEGPRKSGWYKARDRVRARMSAYAGRPVERFTPHDFRRTVRSNTKRMKVDFDTAEAMLNHLKGGMERIYDAYEFAEEKAAAFLVWELEIIRLAKLAGVAKALDIPGELFEDAQTCVDTLAIPDLD